MSAGSSGTTAGQAGEGLRETPSVGPGAAPSDAVSAGLKNMQQLIQLRWIAVVGQIATISAVHFGSASGCRSTRC